MNLPSLTSTTVPLVPTRDMADLVDRYSNKIETIDGRLKAVISSALAPSPRARQALAHRRSEIAACLRPTSERHIVGQITKMKVALASPALDEKTAQAEVRVFIEALANFPDWAISRAALRFIRDEVREPNGKKRGPYFPKAPEMVRECEALLTEARVEAARIDRILNAEVVDAPSAIEREASFAKIDEVVAAFRETNDVTKLEERRRAEERLFRAREVASEAASLRSHRTSEQAEAGFIPSMSLSEELAASIAAKEGRGPVDDEAKTPA
jgi:hypothetical protein